MAFRPDGEESFFMLAISWLWRGGRSGTQVTRDRPLCPPTPCSYASAMLYRFESNCPVLGDINGPATPHANHLVIGNRYEGCQHVNRSSLPSSPTCFFAYGQMCVQAHTHAHTHRGTIVRCTCRRGIAQE